jgi:hypothetical protein
MPCCACLAAGDLLRGTACLTAQRNAMRDYLNVVALEAC